MRKINPSEIMEEHIRKVVKGKCELCEVKLSRMDKTRLDNLSLFIPKDNPARCSLKESKAELKSISDLLMKLSQKIDDASIGAFVIGTSKFADMGFLKANSNKMREISNSIKAGVCSYTPDCGSEAFFTQRGGVKAVTLPLICRYCIEIYYRYTGNKPPKTEKQSDEPLTGFHLVFNEIASLYGYKNVDVWRVVSKTITAMEGENTFNQP